MRREFAMAALAGFLLAGTGCAQTQAGQESPEAGKRPPAPREHGSVHTAPPAGNPRAAEPSRPDQLVNRMAEDLAGRLGVKMTELQVLVVEPVQWSDSSLGCAQPGQMYTQVVTPGLRALFQYAGKTYQYHGSQQGHFLYCANPQEPAGKFDTH